MSFWGKFSETWRKSSKMGKIRWKNNLKFSKSRLSSTFLAKISGFFWKIGHFSTSLDIFRRKYRLMSTHGYSDNSDFKGYHPQSPVQPAMTPGGRVLDQKSDGGVRTGNLKTHPTTQIFFSDIDPYVQIFDEYFTTFRRVLDSFLMIIREFDSNYELLDDNWRFWEDFWWIPLHRRTQIPKYTHIYIFCSEKKPTHIVRTSPSAKYRE